MFYTLAYQLGTSKDFLDQYNCHKQNTMSQILVWCVGHKCGYMSDLPCLGKWFYVISISLINE